MSKPRVKYMKTKSAFDSVLKTLPPALATRILDEKKSGSIELHLTCVIQYFKFPAKPDTEALRPRNIRPGSSNKYLNKLISILEQPLKIINWFNAI
jgi:hypothetical protein